MVFYRIGGGVEMHGKNYTGQFGEPIFVLVFAQVSTVTPESPSFSHFVESYHDF